MFMLSEKTRNCFLASFWRVINSIALKTNSFCPIDLKWYYLNSGNWAGSFDYQKAHKIPLRKNTHFCCNSKTKNLRKIGSLALKSGAFFGGSWDCLLSYKVVSHWSNKILWIYGRKTHLRAANFPHPKNMSSKGFEFFSLHAS